MKEKITCIYCIRDLRRNKNKIIYVGSTRNFYQRKQQLFNSKELFISKFIKKNGKDNFQMVILKKLNPDIETYVLRQWEQFFIKKYKTKKNGCNIVNAVHTKIFAEDKSDLENKIDEINKNLKKLMKKI